MNSVVRNSAGQPFSRWKPADKFEHAIRERHPELCLAGRMVLEHRFDLARKWRLDFAWPGCLVAVEIDGFGRGGHGGGHQRPAAISKDHQKQNAAVAQGWRVIRFTSACLGSRQKVDDAADLVAQVLCGLKD